jgi:ABC-type uncharacterized transport system permease subunit
MIAIAHFIAISCYLGATALAAVPLARPVPVQAGRVASLLAIGVLAHVVALAAVMRESGMVPITGLGPALSSAGCALAIVLLIVELVAKDVSMTLAAAPLAALVTIAANVTNMRPITDAATGRSIWLMWHIVLALLGIAAYGTAAAAGAVYLLARRELRSRKFGAMLRVFPSLETLDRVNHLSLIGGFLGLTVAITLAASYSVAYGTFPVLELIWGVSAWVTVGVLALGRLMAGWQARRAAFLTTIGFLAVLAAYVVLRINDTSGGQFL